MSIIGFVLGIKDYIAPWFYDMQSIKKTLYAPIVPMAQVLNLWLLLMDKRYNEFYAACRFALDTSSNMTGNIKFIMPQMYRLIFLAVSKRNNGKQPEAWKYFREAFDIALPDQIYLPFAQEECIKYFLDELDYTDSTFLTTLCERQQKGRNVIRKAILHKKSPLTPREREIALLFKDRMSRKEIADKLYISEETVKSTLRAVYSKLEIHSRRELNTKDF
jgi:LuxR family maltose regulon positive regulatory protein